MAITYRAVAVGGSTSGTGNRTVTITPAVGDLLVVYCLVAANTQDAPTCSDNNGSGTYDRIRVETIAIAAVNYRLSVFVRTALMVNTTSTVITVATGSNSSGAVHCYACSGALKAGSSVVRQNAGQTDQAAGTPAPAFGASALTESMTLGVVGNGTNPAGMTAPTSWTEPTGADTGFANDALGLGYRVKPTDGGTVAGFNLEHPGSGRAVRSIAMERPGSRRAVPRFDVEYLRSLGDGRPVTLLGLEHPSAGGPIAGILLEY